MNIQTENNTVYLIDNSYKLIITKSNSLYTLEWELKGQRQAILTANNPVYLMVPIKKRINLTNKQLDKVISALSALVKSK